MQLSLERATTHRAAVVPIDGLRRFTVERTTAEADNDKVTEQTIQVMARYVRDALKDPLIIGAASQAQARFGSGSALASSGDTRSRGMLDAWGVFWFIKHAVKFQSDDGKALQYPQLAADRGDWLQDLLVSPSVLLRLNPPKEDCDGFTMLTAALLSVLGLPAYFVTVAADPSEPGRWSHVFAATVIDGKAFPLDTSHGKYPGWMVPAAHIFRLQAWDLDGKRVDLKFPEAKRHTLHGYYRRGMGDCNPYVDPETGQVTTDINCTTGDTSVTSTVSYPPASAPSGNFLQSILQAISGAGAATRTIAGTVAAPPGYVYNPVTGGFVPGSAAYGATVSPFGVTGSIPWLPILAVGALAFLFMGSRK